MGHPHSVQDTAVAVDEDDAGDACAHIHLAAAASAGLHYDA